MAQKLESKRETSKGLITSLAIRYGVTIAVLFVASYLLEASGLTIGPLYVITLPTAITLIPHFFGRVLEIRRHSLSGDFLKSFLTPSVFVFFFFYVLGTILFGFLGSNFVYYALGFPAILLLANGIILTNFGERVIGSGANTAEGLVAKKFSTSIVIFLLYYLSSISPTYHWLSLTFLFPSIVYGSLAFTPLFVLREKYREDAAYLMDSAAKLAAAAAVVGFTLSVFFLFPSIYLFAGILVMAGIVLAYGGYKFYSLSVAKINSIQQELYQKHRHMLNLTDDDNFAFVKGPIGEFVSEGRKGNLIIAFTALLTNAGSEAQDIMRALEFLTGYEIPQIFSYPGLNLSRALEQQVLFRIGLVNDTMRKMSELVGGKK